MAEELDPELAAERAALAEIRRVHHSHLSRARRSAERLAAEAAEMTEEGIRDLVDEDAEVDAAVRAALVRQTSDRTMHAFRRVQELESMGEALAFGHTTDENEDRLYVGRLSVIDDDDALLVDWRARAAMPFYRATPLESLGVRSRRHLFYGDGIDHEVDEISGFSDEVFDINALAGEHRLRGEAAILASVSAPTDSQMRSVVATIQSEQDRVVRASNKGALVVQGGPGTGKTVVALHRAAYLLYDQRAELSDTGVLIVGPSKEFLRYIAGVLPSLGESGVVSVTASELYPGVRRGRPEPAEVAEVKGRACMAQVMANAISDRRRRPVDDLVVRYGASRARVASGELVARFERAGRYREHNEGANAFRALVIEALCTSVFDPSFANRQDALDTFSSSPEVEEFLLRHWPPLSSEQALNDLLGSRSLLRLAARGQLLTNAECRLIGRQRIPEDDLDDARWSDADIPLLDELLVLVGGRMGGQTEEERILERDAATEFELSEQDETGPSMLDAFDDVDFDENEDDEEDSDLFVSSLDDSTVADYGSDGAEYQTGERLTLEDDRFGYG